MLTYYQRDVSISKLCCNNYFLYKASPSAIIMESEGRQNVGAKRLFTNLHANTKCMNPLHDSGPNKSEFT